MLYDRWREIANQHATQVAIYDAGSRQRWTFRQLADAAEKHDRSPKGIVCPQGHSVEFVLALLNGWRGDNPACPLELSHNPPAWEKAAPHCAHIKLTSATTGSPKAILFSGAQLAADVDQIVSTMGLRRDWPNLGVISLAHSYGFSNLILPVLLHGIPLILAAPPLPEIVRQAAKLVPDLTLPAVPALWQAWHEANAIPPNVRLAISAGAPLSIELESAVFAKTGIKIHNFYGASECGGIAYDSSATPRDDASYAGLPMKNVRVEIGDDGCLGVHSKAAGMCYWPDADERLGNGVFLTSDIVEIKSNGVYLRGRAAELINIAGRKVSPERVEKELLQHGSVRDCLVFGAPDSDSSRGEMIVAVVVARDTTEKELRDFLLNRLPVWQVPRMWRFVDALPRNERGKISRAEWRKKLVGL